VTLNLLEFLGTTFGIQFNGHKSMNLRNFFQQAPQKHKHSRNTTASLGLNTLQEKKTHNPVQSEPCCLLLLLQ